MNAGTSPGSLWLAVRRARTSISPLTVELPGGVRALAVFGSPEEARAFLEREPGTWRLRETTSAEIVSFLFDPRAGVRRVVLDPLPDAAAGCLNSLLGIGRESFARRYLRMEATPHTAFERAAPPLPPV